MLSSHQVIDILQKSDFVRIRQNGSHITMRREYFDALGKPIDSATVIVPDHREIAIGTLASIVRQSRLPREYFE